MSQEALTVQQLVRLKQEMENKINAAIHDFENSAILLPVIKIEVIREQITATSYPHFIGIKTFLDIR